jgi:transcriptional regulator with XRE-family HTH domain
MEVTLPLAETAVREIRAEMARQRRSANALAADLGVSDMYLSRRLSGRVPFDLADLERVATALRVPVDQLLLIGVAAT